MLYQNRYVDVLRKPAFRTIWVGFTASDMGDAMTRVALAWYVYSNTRSPAALGLLWLVYGGPVLLGGFLAGVLLDRFNRRTVMVADSVLRGIVVGAVPILAASGILFVWELYVVAGIYGLLRMIPLAGIPSIIPELVDPDELPAANSLESIGFTMAGVVGPVLAGLLISSIGATGVMAFDAASYGIFASALLLARFPSAAPALRQGDPHSGSVRVGMAPVFKLLLSNTVLLSTTAMFMAFNFGEGLFSVWLPVQVAHLANGGPGLYGTIIGVQAVGELLGSTLSGIVSFRIPIGTRICISQGLAGGSLVMALLSLSPIGLSLAIFGMGVFSAPLTVWAQTLRMRILPSALRGRAFAVLRTLMQATGPLAGGIGGLSLPIIGVAGMIGASAILMGAPGALGYRVRQLRVASE